MKEYHKIQTVFKRDPENKFKTLLEGDYSIPEFDYLKNNMWVFTEKVNGTNIRVQFDGSVQFQGKTDNAQIPAPLIAKLIELFPIEKFKSIFPVVVEQSDEVCLYGEGYGAKIQKGGGNYRPDQSFVLFDIKIGDWWLQRKDVEDIAMKLDIEVVPRIDNGCLSDMVSMVKRGIMSQWGNFKAEGIVARPVTELKTRSGHRIITKLKYKDFLKEK